MQQQLTRYVQKNSADFSSTDPACIREDLVNKGVCPSAVTTDQLRVILNQATTT